MNKQCASLFLIKKNLYMIDFLSNLPIDSKREQVKATEIFWKYLFILFK